LKKLIIIVWIIGGIMSFATAWLFSLYSAQCWKVENRVEFAPMGLFVSTFVVALALNLLSIFILHLIINTIAKDAGEKPFKPAISELSYSVRYFPDESLTLFLLKRKLLFGVMLLVPILYLYIAGIMFFLIGPIADLVYWARNIKFRNRFHVYHSI
jgi:hypothetical protein